MGSILLVRHGHAVNEGPRLEDGARWLSRDGRAQATRVGELVREKQLTLDLLLTSPLVRAVQTAELFAQAIGYADPVRCLPDLSFTKSPKAAAESLAELSKTHELAAFGHMPTISSIAALLTRGKEHREFSLCEALYIQDGHVAWSVAPEST